MQANVFTSTSFTYMMTFGGMGIELNTLTVIIQIYDGLTDKYGPTNLAQLKFGLKLIFDCMGALRMLIVPDWRLG